MVNRFSLTLLAMLALCAGAPTLAATLADDAVPPAAAAALAPAPTLAALVEDFVYGSLALQPVAATAAGYHTHQGVPLDGSFDDYSEPGVRHARRFYRGLAQRLARLDPAQLDAGQQADLEIIRNSVGLNLLELDHLQGYRHNPTLYVELIGNGLYAPYVLEYADRKARFRHIIARLQRLPRLVSQAQANLLDAPEVWNRVAREENDGNITLIDQTLRGAVPVELQEQYAAAAGPALQSLRQFSAWLAGPLAQQTSDWRLGAPNYERKCRFILATGKTPGQLLAAAEADLHAIRAELARVAGPQGIEAALAEVATHHATPDTFMDEARHTLADATAFVRTHELVTLPAGSNLQVIDTPEFMRGIYGVAGFNPAPALEPKLGAFYWVTPIPKDWPQARIDSKLREYNSATMQHLTIHEAMPGHYVQGEFANRVQPLARRILRNIWGNGPYVEGWAVYSQQLLTDEGYLDHDPGLRLALLKQELRVAANTVLDIRLHTQGMSDQQALDFMMHDTYQEREEATAKLQRAQLSSCQLATYYAGWQGWLEVRAHFQQRHPDDFSLRAFHDRALAEGAVSLPALDALLLPVPASSAPPPASAAPPP
jgi:uncharacterized protein (DUF885 family)